MSTSIATRAVLTATMGRNISMKLGSTAMSTFMKTGTTSTSTSAAIDGKPRVR